MGFIKAFTGALGGTFADQWKDYYMPRQGVPATAAIFEAVPVGTNAGRGENTKGSENIISNGSKIVVPEGTALITMQDGAITGFISEPGGYTFTSEDAQSQSIFAGGGLISATIGQSWERFKFGGQPGAQQLAFYVNLKEIPGNKFGTSETIYWNDSYLDLKAGGMARGTYSIKIVDPLLFVKGFVPVEYLQPGAKVFDFADMDNQAGEQLFGEFVSCLDSAIAKLSTEAKANDVDTMEYIQTNKNQLSNVLAEAVETEKQWTTLRGLSILNVSMSINYDEKTQAVLDEIRQDDQEIRKAKRMGEAFNNNMAGMMAAASAEAMKSAASNENGAMMGFMGMNMATQSGVNMMGAVNNMQPQQPVEMPQPATPAPAPAPAEDPYEKLASLKKLLDDGVITQADFDAAKAKLLGL